MNKIIIPVAVLLALLFMPLPVRAASAVVHETRLMRGVKVDLVWVDLNSPRVTVQPVIAAHWKGRPFPAEQFTTFIKRLTPAAAINGTYFDVKSFNPIGTIIINKKLVYAGYRGSAFCFTSNNQVDMFRFGYPGNHKDNLRKYEHVISSGPTMIYNGKVVLDPPTELFRDPGIYRPAKRSAIGVTYHNKLILATVKKPIYMRKLAHIMKDLDCRHALSLDGGSSSALYANGKYITKPSRVLTNCIVVYEQPADMIRMSEIPRELSKL